MSDCDKDIGALFDGEAVDRAVQQGWYRAVRRHRRLGAPLLVLEGDEIVELDPWSIALPSDDEL